MRREEHEARARERRGGWLAASLLALVTSLNFGFLFFRQLVLGEAPYLSWALGASACFPISAVIAFWLLASRRGARLPGAAVRVLLTAALLLGTGGILMTAFRVLASRTGGFG